MTHLTIKQTYTKTLVIALSVATLSACGTKQESYTTDYLYANDDIREKVLAECAENKQTDSNCKNANEAKDRKTIEEYRKQTNR